MSLFCILNQLEAEIAKFKENALSSNLRTSNLEVPIQISHWRPGVLDFEFGFRSEHALLVEIIDSPDQETTNNREFAF